MLEDGLSRAGKNLVMAWPGKIGEDFTPAGDRRELWFTRADVEDGPPARALRRSGRRRSRASGGSVGHGQTMLSTDVRGVEPAGMEMRGAAIAAGRPILEGDLAARRRVAVLGDGVRRRLLGRKRAASAPRSASAGSRSTVVGRLGPRRHATLARQRRRDRRTGHGSRSPRFFALDPRPGKDEDVIDSIFCASRAGKTTRR